MEKLHTTTSNPTTWVRVLFVIGASAAIAYFVPFVGPSALDFIAPRAVNLGILFSMTVGFLMYKSLTRRSDIDHYIALELNKVRRMYHLARHIAKDRPSAQAWLAAVRGGIHEYLGLFSTLTFHEYELGNPLFRHITYAIYSLPNQAKGFNVQLYQSLLEATGQATEAREFIRAKKDDTVPLFSWLVVTVISLAFSGIVIGATPHDPILRATGGLVIFCLFLVLQLIYEHDHQNSLRDRAWAARYVADLHSLEHADRMQ